MTIFAARAGIPNNNKIKMQVSMQSCNCYRYRVVIIVGVIIYLILVCLFLCNRLGYPEIIIRFIRNIVNTIRDTFDNLPRLISYVNIRNVFTPLVFTPLVNEDELQVNYVNRAFEDDSVINNMEEPQDE
ncbi:uncharacterized protein LOC114931406 [Nylanderia fulva]|uniref:uncharacterized protein LOC114931406 n=1 Tax=Nylanderia fulva TaxID=613905 RepID=UPI0010FB0DE6|nr:uncharacterized protein LOC114931406 [Nylanderia fulva]